MIKIGIIGQNSNQPQNQRMNLNTQSNNLNPQSTNVNEIYTSIIEEAMKNSIHILSVDPYRSNRFLLSSSFHPQRMINQPNLDRNSPNNDQRISMPLDNRNFRSPSRNTPGSNMDLVRDDWEQHSIPEERVGNSNQIRESNPLNCLSIRISIVEEVKEKR